ncbi:MAG TPA: hypothetical protein VGN48_18770 [Pedococcus sp.]|jgi:hypothetical protein|nr:hypothetical protein [Pedococcus sp.]
MTGDPGQLRLLAARVRHEAERVRTTAHGVDHASDVAWQSAAAHAFRSRVGRLVMGLRMVAQDLDDGARAIEVHAAAVQSAHEMLGRVVQSGQRLTHEAIRQVSGSAL